ncbi:NADH:flavin oxidoreductase/NADH oxidase [Actinomycetospora sp. TBRC 11914]|uniref:NADH:flavin oxidoreductase/NADH oxidase n=1 Tax=Actinomycetospora sp. TBRC 11914 TaxID=2729387 RepID=UPI00145E90BA|nr:NADH:flavin oxidoreductase/NADH oxidase [Actinomycetospora sp. TBRC 11914]NMO88194.1 NADH:flavin oxidoreductase/NADH oxidase [Actinomycetospora sp. TBRC 11914]
MTSELFTPITLRGTTVRNRIWVAPMCQYSATDGLPDDWHLVHLGQFAAGGAGLVMTEASAVVPEGRISPQDAGIWNDEQVAAWRRIVDFLHARGATAAMQLAHAGRKASTIRPWEGSGPVTADDGGWTPVAPSAEAFADYTEPHALSLDEIAALPGAFAAGARRALTAGFDVVELHFAHGYLVHQFLSPLSNHRDDAYGGSFDHRIRLAVEIVEAVRAEVGDDVPVLARISATDWSDGGWTADDSVALARALAQAGADLVDTSTGGNVPHADIPVGPGYQVPFAERIRREADVPTGAVGLITDPAQAEKVLATGQADVVLLARAFLRDPHWPMRAAHELGVADQVTWPDQYARAARWP